MPPADAATPPAPGFLYYRHRLPVRSHALDQRRRADRPADERAQHLRCAFGALLGRFLLQREAAGTRDRRDDEPRERHARRHPRIRPRFRHHRRARCLEGPERRAHESRASHGGSPFPTTAGCRWRASGISSSPGCLCSTDSRISFWSIGSRHLARDLAPDRGDLRAIRRSRSSTICASGIRPGRRRSATTCCRSLPICP